MNLFQLYADKATHSELAELFNFASTRQQFGLAANFLEKDLWVTEVLRLLPSGSDTEHEHRGHPLASRCQNLRGQIPNNKPASCGFVFSDSRLRRLQTVVCIGLSSLTGLA